MQSMTPTTKQAKAQAIHQAAICITEYYGVPAHAVLSDIPRKGKAIQNARNDLMRHLRRSGMSYDAIGRIVRRSADTVRIGCRLTLLPDAETQAMLDSLPAIPHTLSLTTPQ